MFLYRQVLKREIGRLEGLDRGDEPPRRPVAFTRDEERAVLARLNGVRAHDGEPLHTAQGCGFLGSCRLRVRDIDKDIKSSSGDCGSDFKLPAC